MNDWIETVSFALFHSVRTEFFVLVAVFAIISAVTVAFIVHELKNDIS